MHTYEALWDADVVDVPDLDDYRFNDALDVVAYAQHERCIGWRTWPEVWHLDASGKFQCYFAASTLSSLDDWATYPYDLLASRYHGLRSSEGCADRWLVIDSRPKWMMDGDLKSSVCEDDVRAFCEVRQSMADIGVHLVDVMVFDDQRHWWSLHELTSRTTTWSKEPPAPRDPPKYYIDVHGDPPSWDPGASAERRRRGRQRRGR